MTKRKKHTFTAGLLVVLASAALGYWMWWRPRADRATCCWQMRNYDVAIQSCGIDQDAGEAWKSPTRTERLVVKLFDQEIPKCPAGGVHSIAYGRKAPHEWLPSLRCSLHGGGDLNTAEDDSTTAMRTEMHLKTHEAEQASAGPPATRSESDSEGGDKPKPESEGRSR